jgi:hypothetical protein
MEENLGKNAQGASIPRGPIRDSARAIILRDVNFLVIVHEDAEVT